jgi:hypothetical protein
MKKLSNIKSKEVSIDGVLLYSTSYSNNRAKSSTDLSPIKDEKAPTSPRSKSFYGSSNLKSMSINILISRVKSKSGTKYEGNTTVSTLMVGDLPYFTSKDIQAFDLNTFGIIDSKQISTNKIATHKKVGKDFIFNDSIVTVKDYYVEKCESKLYKIRSLDYFPNAPAHSDAWPCLYIQHGENSLLIPINHMIIL